MSEHAHQAVPQSADPGGADAGNAEAHMAPGPPQRNDDNGGCTKELFSKWYYRILRFGSMAITVALILVCIAGFNGITTD